MKQLAKVSELKYTCPDTHKTALVKHDFKLGTDDLTRTDFEKVRTIHVVIENCPLCDKIHVLDMERFY